MNKQKLYEIIKIVCTAIISIAGTLLVESCVLTRNSVRHSTGVTIDNQTKSEQSADSASINLKDFAK